METDTGESAVLAMWLACRTNIASVEDEPMVGRSEQIVREPSRKLLFSLQWRSSANREPYAGRDTKHMGVDSNSLLMEEYRDHDIGSLASYTRQSDKAVEIGWHLTIEPIDKKA